MVLQDQSLDKILEAHQEQVQNLEVEQKSTETLDYYSKHDKNGKPSSNLPKRPKRPARQDD